MSKKKIWIPALLLAIALTACGVSDEKLAEARQAISLMSEAGQAASNTYLDITDSSQKARLDELLAKEAEIEAIELTKLNDKKIDELIPQINEVTEGFNALNEELGQVLTSETTQKQEKEKHKEQTAFFINKTGMNLTEIRLHDLTIDELSDNYLGDGVILEAGYTLMGVALDVYDGSNNWEFVIKSDADTEYVLSCPSLLPVNESGVSIELLYDPETGEGSVNIGGYAAEQETTTEESTTEEASEGESTQESATDATSGE